MKSDSEELRRDVAASVEARRELGPAYEDDLVESFLDRIDARLEQRAGSVSVDPASRRRDRTRKDQEQTQRFVVALVSLGTGVPITAIAGMNGGVTGTALAWLGIVGVNVVFGRDRSGR